MKRATKLLDCGRVVISSFEPTSNSSIHVALASFCKLTHSPVSKLLPTIQCGAYDRRLFFSSNPEPLIEGSSLDNSFLPNDWSPDIESGVGDSKLEVTHESVMYALKKLSKDPIKAAEYMRWTVEKQGFEPSSSIYSLMLRICCTKDSLKEFWFTIKEMKERGCHIEKETYRTAFSVFRGLKMENEATALKHFYSRLVKENAMEDKVKEVVDVIKGSEWGDKLERKLSGMKIMVSDNFMLRVLNELRGKGLSLKAYRFFKWVDECLGYKHNSITFNGILRVLCWKDTNIEFWNVFEEMKTAGFEMDIDTYVKVSRQLQKSKMLEDAVKLYEHMMDSSYKPSFSECNHLLRTLATYGDPDLGLVYRAVEKYEAAGNSLTKNIYDGIHRSLTSLGKFEEAEEIVETMRKAGYEPDNVTYSQLIFGLCKAGQLKEAADVLDVMEEQGCSPDIKTWTILIKGHCDANETDKAMLYFTKMMEKGADADADLLDVLINGLLQRSRAADAFKLLLELVQRVRLGPWQATYKNLIEELLRERRLEEAMQLLHSMKKQNYPPFQDPFVHYISKYGSADDALEFFSVLSFKEYPSVSCYQHVFKAFFKEGRHTEARDLLYKCPHHIRKHAAVCSLFGSAT